MRMRNAHLAEVEFGVVFGGDTLDLEEGGVGAGIALPPLVAKDATLAVETNSSRIRVQLPQPRFHSKFPN